MSTKQPHHQESYEVVPEWPEGQPVPRYLTPQSKSTLQRVLEHVTWRLGLRDRSPSSPCPSPPDRKVMNLADSVRRQLVNIYHTSFTTYSVQCYTKTTLEDSEYGEGTLYTIHVSIAPPIRGDTILLLKVFTDMITGAPCLVYHSLQQ